MKFNFNLEGEPPFDNRPAKIEKWYDRKTRSWVVELQNKDGCQLGNASYVATKTEAIAEENTLRKEYNL